MNLAIFTVLVVIIPLSLAGVVEWGAWSACSVSCGKGNRTRTAVCRTGDRTCTSSRNPAPGDTQSSSCSIRDCLTTAVPSPTQPTTSQVTTREEQSVTMTTTTTNSELTASNTTTNEKQSSQPTQRTKTEETQVKKDTGPPIETMPTPPPEEEAKTFEITVKSQEEFKDEFRNKNSEAYKKKTDEFEKPLQKTLDDDGIDATCEVYDITKGSIVIHYRVQSKKSVSSTRLHGSVRSSIQSGPMSSLRISTFSIATSKLNLPDGALDQTAPSDSEVVKPYLYFLYGFGGMIGLVIVFIILAVTKRKVKPAPEVEEKDDYDSYFNTPVSSKKMVNDDYPSKSVQHVYDQPTMEDDSGITKAAW